MERYLNLVVVLNFLVDFLLLLGTNRLAGFPPGLKRCALAAFLGAVYSGACLLPGFRFLGNVAWRLIFLGLMALTAFGFRQSTWKRSGVFLLLAMALGGMAQWFGQGSFGMLALCAGLLWALCRVAFGNGVGTQEYVPVQITHNGQSTGFLALRDTGNVLRDPITGEQVLVVGSRIAARLTGLTREQLSSPLETMTARPWPGLRLIPYHAVGQSGGLLLAMRFSDVRIGAQQRSVVVAFAPEDVGRGQVYQALTGGAL